MLEGIIHANEILIDILLSLNTHGKTILREFKIEGSYKFLIEMIT